MSNKGLKRIIMIICLSEDVSDTSDWCLLSVTVAAQSPVGYSHKIESMRTKKEAVQKKNQWVSVLIIQEENRTVQGRHKEAFPNSKSVKVTH